MKRTKLQWDEDSSLKRKIGGRGRADEANEEKGLAK